MKALPFCFFLAACGSDPKEKTSDPCFLGNCDGGVGRTCESAIECADPDEPCIVFECVDHACRLTDDLLDADGDGHGAIECGGDDCDDLDGSVPAASETCNGADDDCDGIVDEGLYADGTDQIVSDDLASNVTLAHVFEGDGFGVLWARAATGDLTFQLLDAEGVPLGDPQPLSGSMQNVPPTPPNRVALVGVPGGFFAAWGQDGQIGFSEITLESGPEVPGVVPTDDDIAAHVVAAYSGEEIGLGWIGTGGVGRYPTWAIVDVQGNVLVDPTRTKGNTTPDTIGMEWLGDRFGFLFEGIWGATGDGGKILFVEPDGSIAGPGEYTDGDATSPVAVADGELLHVLWNERKPVSLWYRTTNADGGALTNAVEVAPDGYAPDVDSRGAGTLAAWIVGFDVGTGYFGELQAAAIGQSIADVPEGEPADVEILRPMDDAAGTSGPPSVVALPGGGFAIAFAAHEGGVFFDRIDCQ